VLSMGRGSELSQHHEFRNYPQPPA
jgi:hypothetical protein